MAYVDYFKEYENPNEFTIAHAMAKKVIHSIKHPPTCIDKGV
jgi:hypothetical protein